MLWRHPAVRLLLLVLAFGVAGMHTLGHHEDHATRPPAEHHAIDIAEPSSEGGSAMATVPTGDLNPSQMCLAVLTAAALLVLALSAARLRVPATCWRPRTRGSQRTTRGPPGFMATGPLLAEVTVLRI